MITPLLDPGSGKTSISNFVGVYYMSSIDDCDVQKRAMIS
jgi:hypothetical protein